MHGIHYSMVPNSNKHKMYLSLIYSSKIAMPTISPLYICMEKIGLVNVCHMEMEITMKHSKTSPNLEPQNRKTTTKCMLEPLLSPILLHNWQASPVNHYWVLKEPPKFGTTKLRSFIWDLFRLMAWFMNPQMTIFHVFPEWIHGYFDRLAARIWRDMFEWIEPSCLLAFNPSIHTGNNGFLMTCFGFNVEREETITKEDNKETSLYIWKQVNDQWAQSHGNLLMCINWDLLATKMFSHHTSNEIIVDKRDQ